MAIQKSGEDYLETILILTKLSPYTRLTDVANEIGFAKPSVSRAMSILKEEGFIKIEEGKIFLTKTGRERAENVYEKHAVLTSFFRDMLGVSPETAASDACKTEHVLSEESFAALKRFIVKINKKK